MIDPDFIKETAKQLGAGIIAVAAIGWIIWQYHKVDFNELQASQLEMQIQDMDMDEYWVKRNAGGDVAEDSLEGMQLRGIQRKREFAEQRLEKLRSAE